jgi:hypothetical protein
MPKSGGGLNRRFTRRQPRPSAEHALAGQQTPNGYYNLERMLAAAIHRGAEVGLCGTWMDAGAVRQASRAPAVRVLGEDD